MTLTKKRVRCSMYSSVTDSLIKRHPLSTGLLILHKSTIIIWFAISYWGIVLLYALIVNLISHSDARGRRLQFLSME